MIIQTTVLSNSIISKIKTDATNWLNSSSNLQTMFYSYFSNNSPEFNWLEEVMTSRFHYGSSFETKSGNNYDTLSASNFNDYVKFSSVSIANGTPNLNANSTGFS